MLRVLGHKESRWCSFEGNNSNLVLLPPLKRGFSLLHLVRDSHCAVRQKLSAKHEPPPFLSTCFWRFHSLYHFGLRPSCNENVTLLTLTPTPYLPSYFPLVDIRDRMVEITPYGSIDVALVPSNIFFRLLLIRRSDISKFYAWFFSYKR